MCEHNTHNTYKSRFPRDRFHVLTPLIGVTAPPPPTVVGVVLDPTNFLAIAIGSVLPAGVGLGVRVRG